MGIPSYYSYLIKNHSEILEALTSAEHFYLDCNSIIYDIVNQFTFKLGQKMSENETEIILLVIQKIEEYISLILPQKVTITFDGIAPFAKLCQQRERRFKSYYQNKIKKRLKKSIVSDFWDTAKITPGTPFMKLLTKMVKEHFDGRNYNIFACDVPGEGEHKLFEVLRSTESQEKHVVYGLDSDLIMLGMLHLDICPNIFLYRETPVYIKSINPSLDENQDYLLNLRLLSELISKEMGGNIVDYVFISFLMGNDFMPHFPSLNIRTGGIDKIITAYRSHPKQIITIDREKKDIGFNWQNFRGFLSYLCDKEEEYIKTEYAVRERKRFQDTDKWQRFESTPMIDREIEIYINPKKSGWEERYYDSLFDKKCYPEDYIKGLIWNMTYYVFGCIDYDWHYPYHYPPLLKDLIKCVPAYHEHIIWEKIENDITDVEQLCYVLPVGSLHILPNEIRSKLKKEWYVDDCAFSWAFCKYFWESHTDLPEIDFMELRKCLNI